MKNIHFAVMLGSLLSGSSMHAENKRFASAGIMHNIIPALFLAALLYSNSWPMEQEMKALREAFKTGNAIVFLPRERSPEEVEREKNNELLCQAAEDGDIAAVQSLLAQGKNGNDSTKPLRAAIRKGHIEIVKEFLKYNADINAFYGSSKNTPLHVAVRKGRTDIAALLLEHGAIINAADKDGNIPVHMALLRGDLETAKIFLAHHQLDTTLVNERKNGIMHAAAGGKSAETEVLLLLINRGIDINERNEYNETPLHFATRRGHVEITKILLQNKALVNCADDEGRTPLHCAVISEDVALARLLVENGANIHAPDKAGLTPSAYANSKEMVNLLKNRKI